MKRVVYTTIFGNYDKLRIPKIIEKNIDYVCITDNKKLKSKVRKFLYKTSDVSNKVKNRKYKILAHKYFGEYDQSLYVDGNIQITGNVLDLFNKYLNKNNIAITSHPERTCIYQEFDVCIKGRIVQKNIANKQREKYISEGLPKNLGLFETNIILRNHNDIKIKKLMDDRYNEIESYTHRDQLSFTYVIRKNGLESKIGTIKESSRFKNDYFKIYPHNKDNFLDYLYTLILMRKKVSIGYTFLYKVILLLSSFKKYLLSKNKNIINY